MRGKGHKRWALVVGQKPPTKRKPNFASYGLAGKGRAFGCSVQSRQLRLLLRVHPHVGFIKRKWSGKVRASRDVCRIRALIRL